MIPSCIPTPDGYFKKKKKSMFIFLQRHLRKLCSCMIPESLQCFFEYHSMPEIKAHKFCIVLTTPVGLF